MKNPILEKIDSHRKTQSNNGDFSNVLPILRQMLYLLQNSGNPQKMFENMAMNNPAIGSVMNLVGGRNPKDVFYEQCKQYGVDPDEIINQLK